MREFDENVRQFIPSRRFFFFFFFGGGGFFFFFAYGNPLTLLSLSLFFSLSLQVEISSRTQTDLSPEDS